MDSICLSDLEAQELLSILSDLRARNVLSPALDGLLNTLESVALVSNIPGHQSSTVSGSGPLATPPQTPFSVGVYVPPDLPPIPSLLDAPSSGVPNIAEFQFTFTSPSNITLLDSTIASPSTPATPPHTNLDSNHPASDEADSTNTHNASNNTSNNTSSSAIARAGKKVKRQTRGSGKARWGAIVGAGGVDPPDGDDDPLVAYIWLPECDRGGVAVPVPGGVNVVNHALASWQESSTVANTVTVPAATIISAMALAANSDLSNPGTVEWISALQSLVKGESWAESANAFLDNSVSSIISRCQRAISMNIGLEFVLMVNFIQLAAKVDRCVYSSVVHFHNADFYSQLSPDHSSTTKRTQAHSQFFLQSRDQRPTRSTFHHDVQEMG